jgi:3',5'-cyclic AMP phosphodiesterase CpdA
VAFIGDQGLGPNAEAVLALIRDERADFVLHQGDLDYTDDPAAWLAQLDAVLGPDFPYFACVGNHDVPAWEGPTGYQALLEARLANIPDASCVGRYGVNAACTYRGLFFVQSGVGTYDTGHEAFLEQALAGSDAVFKVCTWHKNQNDMQVGAKTDEVGWAAYQLCQQYGALTVTAHEHSYSRTYSLTAVGDVALGHGATGGADLLTLAPGSTAVVVAGLGGMSRRAFLVDQHGDDTWWAAIYAIDRQVRSGLQVGAAPSIEDGALFVDFHVDGDPRKARGYFKTSSGLVVDSFTVVAPKP